MLHSICGLPAVYTVERTITDYRLDTRYIVRVSGRFIGYAESLQDAKCAALLYESLLGGATLH